MSRFQFRGKKHTLNQRTKTKLEAPIEDGTMRNRILIVSFLLVLSLLVALVRTVMLQTVEAPTLKREAARNYMRTVTLDHWRGDITDRQGHLLGVSVHRWAVTVDPQQIADPKRTAAVLAPILNLDESTILGRIDPTAIRPDATQSINPATTFARQLTAPWARMMSEMWLIPRKHFDQRLDILERFFQLEQLRSEAIFGVTEILASAAEDTAKALATDIEKLRFFPGSGRRFAYISRDLEDETIQAIADARIAETKRCRVARERGERCVNALRAVWARPEARRYYPKRNLASQMLGLVGQDGQGLSGIELAMNSLLAGGVERVQAVRDGTGHTIFLDGIPEDANLVGDNIELSIDQQIQTWAEEELAHACLSSGARAGYAIAIRPKTGEILAAANFPNYNPNDYQNWFREQLPIKEEGMALAERRSHLAWAASFEFTDRVYGDGALSRHQELNRSLEQELDAFAEYEHAHPNASRNMGVLDVYEPGSIMKVFTAAAALEEQVVDLDTLFDLERGDWALDDHEGNVIHDTSRMDEGDLALILKKSSNIGASKIGFLLGAEKLEAYMRAFGFGEKTRSGFPGEPKGILRPAEDWVPIELANVSFGQGMAASGIQLAMALGALGNEGKLMRPILIRRARDGAGRVVKSWEPEEIRQVVSPETAATIVDLMRGVVEPDGTGSRAYIPEWPVAGKTGTGQKPHLRRRGYSEDRWVNTFFGLAPADNPEVALVVLIDEPSGKRHGGGLIAAPVFKRIMEKTLDYLGAPSPYISAKRMAWLDPQTLKQRREQAQSPSPTADLSHLAPKIALTEGAVPVPDFRGLTMAEAKRLANRVGIAVRFTGTGIATEQEHAPADMVPADQGVEVFFSSRIPGADQRRIMGPAGGPALEERQLKEVLPWLDHGREDQSSAVLQPAGALP